MGRFIRKIKGGIRCLREHGIRYTAKLLMKEAAKRVLPESFILLNKIFRDNVLAGFRVYSELIETYGDDVTILGCAPLGTGDYFICGLYLQEWSNRNSINKFVFLCPDSATAEAKVAGLFPELSQNLYRIDFNSFNNLRAFEDFIGISCSNIHFLHHKGRFARSNQDSVCITSGYLQGFRNLNMVDYYLLFGFDMPLNTQKKFPAFSKDEKVIMDLFSKKGLSLGNTILISPYSTGLKAHQPQIKFWERLAGKLIENGFVVCTNCSDKEAPIASTTKIFIPYDLIIPFLNHAGGFIGIRSGLCDVISTAACKKVIIHTYNALHWPNGNSIPYTGLKNMGLCDDAIEFEFNEKREMELLDDILVYLFAK